MTHYCSLCFDAIALPGLCESCEGYLAEHPDDNLSLEELETMARYVDELHVDAAVEGRLS